MWMQCTWSAALVSAAALSLKPCSSAEIVRNAFIAWTPEEKFVVPSSPPSGTFRLQPWRRRRPVSRRPLITMSVVVAIVAFAFLVVRCMRKTSAGGSSVHGSEHRYLAEGGLNPCDSEDEGEDGIDPSQLLSHPQLSLLMLSPAEANRLSPEDLQTITRAKERLTSLLTTVADLERQAEESVEQERIINLDLAIADTDRVIMDAAATQALTRRKRGKASPASEHLKKYKEVLRSMDPQPGQCLQELLLVARYFTRGQKLSFVGAAALIASMRINNPEVAMPAALEPNERTMLKEFTETMISEGRINAATIAFLARPSPQAVPKARDFAKHARAAVSYLEQAGMTGEATRLSEVVEDVEKLISSLPPVATTSRTQSLSSGVVEGRGPSHTSARTTAVWLPRARSERQHLRPSSSPPLATGAPYKDTASARGSHTSRQQDISQLELPGVPAAIIPSPPGVGDEPIPAVSSVLTPSSSEPLDAAASVDDPSIPLTEHAHPPADATLSPDKTLTPSDGPAPSALPSLEWGLPPRPDQRSSASGSRVAQRLKTWMQMAKSAISGPTQEGRDTIKIERLLQEAMQIFGQASAAELATSDAQVWVNDASALIDSLRFACGARWRLRCAQQRLSLLSARESLILARAEVRGKALPRQGDLLLRSIMEARARITSANRVLDELRPLSTTPSPFAQLADALQNLQSEIQEAEGALKEEAMRIALQWVNALQGSTEGEPAAASAAPSSSSASTSAAILQAREVLTLLKQVTPSSVEVQSLEEQLRQSREEETFAESAPSRWRSVRRPFKPRWGKSKEESRGSDKGDKE